MRECHSLIGEYGGKHENIKKTNFEISADFRSTNWHFTLLQNDKLSSISYYNVVGSAVCENFNLWNKLDVYFKDLSYFEQIVDSFHLSWHTNKRKGYICLQISVNWNTKFILCILCTMQNPLRILKIDFSFTENFISLFILVIIRIVFKYFCQLLNRTRTQWFLLMFMYFYKILSQDLYIKQ